LLTAQYAVESKQVTDDALSTGHKGDDRDDAYHFLKNVRGSPAYFQKVMYDVLGMIRQLGLPTLFLTLSTADMQ